MSMLSNIARRNARAKVPMPHDAVVCDAQAMRDWAIDYILHVLEAKNWSANKLAEEAGLASSTIARPLRTQHDPRYRVSRTTIHKIAKASGIDPAPFAPPGMEDEAAVYDPATSGARILAALENLGIKPNGETTNEIKVAVAGPYARIVATVDRTGLAKLRAKLDAIESMLDD
jgi:lambda repressor-like predicted transcriptional regulator